MNDYDELNEIEDDDCGLYDPARLCDCGLEADTACDLCGAPMCFECFSASAGICNAAHTCEQWEEYAAALGYLDQAEGDEP
jgi:hypothetical protein